MTQVIDRFRDEWGFLSNFHPAPMVWEGIHYPTSEHAFNAGKTLDAEERLRIAVASTPGIAKRMGRRVTLRPEWEERVRYEVMRSVLRAKFLSKSVRTEHLLRTGDAELVEGNVWHDNHWGNCTCTRLTCASPGENWLGRMLMELRAELRDCD
jgi:ribA/ribD-fused uncharacterized protein